ncbi:MAG: phosphate acyltransferase [Elusimicrobia bacterium]|nr:phosphate acyltransferase [Elusimicrobiota bacterium]
MNKVSVALDAMGGDLGPEPLVAGALSAVRSMPTIMVSLVGVSGELERILGKLNSRWRSLAISVVHSDAAVEMGEGTFSIARKRKGSSIVQCLRLHQEGDVQGVVSAGSTAASVLWSIDLLKTFPEGGFKPCLPAPWPNSKGHTLLVDAGASPDVNSIQLAHFAILGSLYAKVFFGREKVRVGLLSIGEERSKGSATVKEAYARIEKALGDDFAGMVEGRDLPTGKVDVVVCDAFVGNIMLKLGEGFVEEAGRMLKKNLNLLGKIGGFLMLPSLKKLKKKLSWEAVGAAPLLGVRGNVFVAHGRSTPLAIHNALINCARLSSQGMSQVMLHRYEELLNKNPDLFLSGS